ncbi:hypothetical protein D918_05415 [Trichuris suis]|nr:hypothetical protein D918_05415 [Trichuris suis]
MHRLRYLLLIFLLVTNGLPEAPCVALDAAYFSFHSMTTRFPLRAEDFVDTPFPRDQWRAFDNFVLSSLVLCCQPPFYEAIDWQKICDTLEERTYTEFKPGYLNALSCEFQYALLEGHIIRLHMQANKDFPTRKEIGELLRDIFYMKFLKTDGPTLKRILATYGVWQEVVAAIEAKRMPAQDGIDFGKEVIKKIREVATEFKCPCEPIRLGPWWRDCPIEDTDELVKPVPEEVILKLMEQQGSEDSSAESEGSVKSVAEELATLSTVDQRSQDDAIAKQETCGPEKATSDAVVIVEGTSQQPSSLKKGKAYSEWLKLRSTLLSLLDIACEHKESLLFERRVLGNPIYNRLVRHPVYLSDIRRDIRNGQISSVPALRKKLVLMFNNAFFSNSVKNPRYEAMVHMCVDVMKTFDERAAMLQSD